VRDALTRRNSARLGEGKKPLRIERERVASERAGCAFNCCRPATTENRQLRRVGAVAATLVVAASAGAQKPSDSPEPVIRGLVRAMYSNDAVGFKRLTLPNPRIDLLTTGRTINQDGLRELEEDPGGLQIIMKRSFEHRGVAAKPDPAGKYLIGTTAVYVVAHHRSPIVMVVEKRNDGWKVDPRWWIGMVDLASDRAPGPGTAAYAARALLASLISMDRNEAVRYAVPGADLDFLFDGAPSQREPSGYLDALAMEMPVVELFPGEFRVLPTGKVVEGSARQDVKLLVGLLGSVEIPFVVRLIGKEWKVEPQPYFALINQ
jgi:hypothetical protein